MIRINLLGVPRKAKGRRAASTVAVPGEGSSTVVLALFVVAGLVVAVALSYLWVKKETERLNIEYARAEAENHRLSDVKAKYEASKRKADQFERRVKVIDELKEAQKGPVNMLNLVADTVNRTDAVWLEDMASDGKAINFTGMALSADAVADLMANLRKTNAFKTVEIKETSQDPQIKELQAFKFELICEIALSNKVQAKS